MVAQRTKPEAPAEGPTVVPSRRSTRSTPARPAPAGTPRSSGNGTRTATRRPATRATGPSVESMAKDLLAAVKRHDSDIDLDRIRRAIDFAIEAHGEQVRASVEPYVTHPIAAAQILAVLQADPAASHTAALHHGSEDAESDVP